VLTLALLVILGIFVISYRARIQRLEIQLRDERRLTGSLANRMEAIELQLRGIGATAATLSATEAEPLPGDVIAADDIQDRPSAPAAAPASAVPHEIMRPPWGLFGRRPATERARPAIVMQHPAEPTEPSALRQSWARIERQLIENWSGILGAAVLVAGITFLGGYTGVRLSPVYRVLMIAAAAAVLFAAAEVVRRRYGWLSLAQWLRSAGAAVFLFAAFASSAVPPLTWVTGLTPALALVLLGISVNLAVAYNARHPAFASLHAVLSLVPLALAPQSELLLAIATTVTLAAVGIAFRKRWDLHHAIVLAAFAVFHIAWYRRVAGPAPSLDLRLLGATSALLVGGLIALSHYRRSYPSVAPLPLGAHLAGWLFAVAGLAVYAGTPAIRGLTLIALAAVVFVLARLARRAGIRWLFLTDTLVAQTVAVVGVVALAPVVFNTLLIPVVLLGLTGAYLKVGLDENEPLLERIGLRATQVAAPLVALYGLTLLADVPKAGNQNGAVLLAGALLAGAAHVYFLRRRAGRGDYIPISGEAGTRTELAVSPLATSSGLIAAVALAHFADGGWMESVALVATALYLLAARRSWGRAFAVAVFFVLVPAFLMSWARTYAAHPVPPFEQLRAWIPLLLAGAVALAHRDTDVVGRLLRRSATYLVGLSVGLAAYTLLQPVSSLAPAVAWLTLSLLALELANRIPSERIAPVLHVGFLYLSFFAAAYLLVVLQTDLLLGSIPVRVLIGAYALAVMTFWWRFRPRSALAEHGGWRQSQPYLLEAGLLLLTVAIVADFPEEWRPAAWVVLAIVAGARTLGGRLDPRFQFYSVLFFWASAADLVATTSDLVTAALPWYRTPFITGALTIAGQIAYLAMTARHIALARLGFPRRLGFLARWSERVAARQAVWLYYPFFAAVALFVYWRFDAAWWTPLWAAEAFVIFVLSLVLRESLLRHLAVAALAVSVVRLLVYDMAQADLGVRGLIFIGVGLLMLGMNTLYNRYKERLA
jgi:hypothetical protein